MEAQTFPRTCDEIYDDYQKRRAGLLKALTDDAEDFFNACDPDKENLCLYGTREGTWHVSPPAEEVPPLLPEPCLGINFARDGMPRRDWLALVAVHSDTWLMSVAFYYGVKLDINGRAKLFKLINQQPTLFEVVTNRKAANKPGAGPPPKKQKFDRPTESAFPSGKLIKEADVGPQLRGRQAEMFWPDDQKWYLVEITHVNPKTKQAKITYATGEFEEVDLDEMVRDGHMTLL
uniref:Alfin N-terminal domain-containing protein n=1 Tax=Chlamydomonas leiostraca TaxID=1034604 RepID=A0A7S0RHN9_9CHLO|mmetsp:Transcript_22863/g.58268  ORF Transcript_22863/g.58268 Transcript_22863/m.58268 type:complete len:233 (+) Transcript_22863:185-883(+)